MKRTLLWLLPILLGMAALTALAPAEKSLGVNVRIVYLHGAWVWTALITLGAAGVSGFLALITNRPALHAWSRALGWSGLIFWFAYLPLSAWASETNWNGLYLAEPRWRVALIFAVTGVLLQTGLVLINRPRWTSAANLCYILALAYALATAERVMHPPSPIFSSDSLRIQLFFIGLVGLTLLAAGLLAGFFRRLERAPQKSNSD